MSCIRNTIITKFTGIIRTKNVRYITTKRDFKEINIEVPWGHLAGKWWEPYDMRPILTLHGWKDNCGTFDRLIPLLNKNVGFLTIDLPGHGYSSRLPRGTIYDFKTYLITIEILVNYFNWQKISLMGHSMGGALSYLYTMINPNVVDFVVCIEGSKPRILKNRNIFVANNLINFLKYEQYANNIIDRPSYTIEEAHKKMCISNRNSISAEYLHLVMERNISPSETHPGKYNFTGDPRLNTLSMEDFSQNELIQYVQKMTPPIFIVNAKRGLPYKSQDHFNQFLDVLKRASTDCDFHLVEGTHYVHLNNPENISDLVKEFIRRHSIDDRSVGGITDDIIIDKRVTNILSEIA